MALTAAGAVGYALTKPPSFDQCVDRLTEDGIHPIFVFDTCAVVFGKTDTPRTATEIENSDRP